MIDPAWVPPMIYMVNGLLVNRDEFIKSFMTHPIWADHLPSMLRQTNDHELMQKLVLIVEQEGHG